MIDKLKGKAHESRRRRKMEYETGINMKTNNFFFFFSNNYLPRFLTLFYEMYTIPLLKRLDVCVSIADGTVLCVFYSV